MLKKIALVLLVAFVGGMIASCAHTLPVAATSNPVGKKVGEASSTMILGIFAPDGGDASIRAAAANGGITRISTVDQQIKMIFLTFVMSRTTIVTGE